MVLWRLPTLPGLTQVSSAVPGLTSLFGMGRGEHRANSHQQDFLLVNQQCLLSYSMTNIEFHVILEVEENKSEIYYLVKNNVQAVG